METIHITGMTCGHCVRTIERAVGTVPDLGDARVNLPQNQLTYSGAAPREAVIAAIRDAGYDVEES